MNGRMESLTFCFFVGGRNGRIHCHLYCRDSPFLDHRFTPVCDRLCFKTTKNDIGTMVVNGPKLMFVLVQVSENLPSGLRFDLTPEA